MKIDRDKQRAILEYLDGPFPDFVEAWDLTKICGIGEVTRTCAYLHEHGLVEALMSDSIGEPSQVVMAKITAKGIDFLADDGGLSAILGVVTIKFHDETIRQLVESRILESDAPEAEKQGLIQALRQAPADSIKHLTTRLLDAGLENLPRAVQLVQTWIQSAPV